MEEVPELGRGVGSPCAHLAAHVARAVRATRAVRMASLGGPGWVNRSSVVLVGQSGVLRVEEGRVSVARQPEEVWGRPMRPRPCVPPRPPGPSRTPPAAEAGKPTLVGVWDCQARPPLLGSCGSRYCHCCPGRPRVRHPPWRLTCGGSSPSGWSLGQGSLGQEGLGRKARCK